MAKKKLKPTYSTKFNVNNISNHEGKKIGDTYGRDLNTQTNLLDYINKNSYNISSNATPRGTLESFYLTPDNILIKYSSDSYGDGFCDTIIELTSFSTNVDGLSKKLQEIAIEATFKK